MSETAFSQSHNADELGQYRSLSTLAVVALLLGLASPLFFTARAFSAIPVAGVAVALVALLRIHASQGSQTGATIAKLGLLLSVVFFVAPHALSYVRDSTSLRMAERTAHRWVDAVSHQRWGEAATLTDQAKLYSLLPRSSAPDAPPPRFDLAMATTEMSQEETAQSLSTQDKVELTLLEASFQWGTRTSDVVCVYDLSGNDSDLSAVMLILTRRTGPEGGVLWLIKDGKSVDSNDLKH